MLIYVKYSLATGRYTAAPVTGDTEKRAAFRVSVARDMSQGGMTSRWEQARQVAQSCSRKIGAWERDTLRMSGDAMVSARHVGEDAHGWYFIRKGAFSGDITWMVG